MDADIQNYSGHIVTSREGRVSRNTVSVSPRQRLLRVTSREGRVSRNDKTLVLSHVLLSSRPARDV